MKNITILGVTGSIGTQTVEVCLSYPELFSITAMSAGKNIVELERILSLVDTKYICVLEKEDCDYLTKKYPDKHFYYGEEGLLKLVTLDEVNIVLNGIVGFAGLLPTIEAIKHHKDIAIANKETLVVSGHIIIPLVKEYNVSLLPVDSEHSAIFQCLHNQHKDDLKSIILTCSGSFRNKTYEELQRITIDQALTHPNWSMGAKITIDSATLVNKGLEVMEAKWLFEVDYDDIQVVIHPESIIHSMIEMKDGAVLAQLGTPDMKLPIQYALTYPRRMPVTKNKRLDFTSLNGLHFYEVDNEKFPALSLAYKAGRTGHSMPCVYNGANEMANQLFREGKISFLNIVELISKAMDHHSLVYNPTLEELIEIDRETRDYVLKEVETCNL